MASLTNKKKKPFRQSIKAEGCCKYSASNGLDDSTMISGQAFASNSH